MDGLMMQVPLTLVHFFDRARKYFAATEIVSRRPDKTIQRSTYGEFHRRAQKLANALTQRSEEHTSELQSRLHLVCRLLLEKKKKYTRHTLRELIIQSECSLTVHTTHPAS